MLVLDVANLPLPFVLPDLRFQSFVYPCHDVTISADGLSLMSALYEGWCVYQLVCTLC